MEGGGELHEWERGGCARGWAQRWMRSCARGHMETALIGARALAGDGGGRDWTAAVGPDPEGSEHPAEGTRPRVLSPSLCRSAAACSAPGWSAQGGLGPEVPALTCARARLHGRKSSAPRGRGDVVSFRFAAAETPEPVHAARYYPGVSTPSREPRRPRLHFEGNQMECCWANSQLS